MCEKRGAFNYRAAENEKGAQSFALKTIEYKLGEKYSERPCALALGFFDGVHKGHRELLTKTVGEARNRGIASAVFTFRYGGGPKGGRNMIYSEREREELLSSLGIDVCFVADFSELKDMTPEDFVKKTVTGDIGAAFASVGYNYRFGKGGTGDARKLSELMRQEGAEALVFDAYTEGGEPVSSTRVRSLLEGGGLDEANAMLGVPYFISGTVEHGRGDGKRFGFPTVNTAVEDGRVHLPNGVYLTAVKIGEKLHTGLTNVGECPSFGKRNYHAETFLLDFSDDVYGMEIKVYFLSFLREERVFTSARELALQIEKDRAIARERMKNIKWQEIGRA